MRISFVSLIVLTLLFSLTTGYAEPPAGKSASVETTSQRGYHYRLTADSEHMEAMKPLPVALRVTDPSGKPVTEATISCSLTMPAMAMPLNTPTLKREEGREEYRGVFLLTMGGLWYMETTAAFPDGSRDTAVLAFSATEPNAGDDSVNKKLEDLFQNKSETKQP